jgi:hypothetical protein
VGRSTKEFFHGTGSRFSSGDLILPKPDPDDGLEGEMVFSTNNQKYAEDYGKYVYQVEPTGDETPEQVYSSDDPREDPEWASKAKELYGDAYSHHITRNPMKVVRRVK